MKKVIITLALILAAGSMFAQEVEKGSKQRWRNFETNRFIDNWELSVGAGAQTFHLLKFSDYTGHTINPEGFGKDITLLPVDITIGKWVTPIVGARLAFTHGGLLDPLTNYGAVRPGKDSVQALNYSYWSIHADAMINLTNWICRYKADRFYNAILFLGVGYSKATVDGGKNDGENRREFVVPIGLINRFRLCDAWTFNIELRDQLSRPQLLYGNADLPNKSIVGNLLTATAGFTWKFSKVRHFNAYTPIDKSLYDNRISALEKDLQNANEQNAEYQKQNAEYQKQIERYKQQLSDKEKELQEALRKAAKNSLDLDDVTLSVFFTIGSAEISEKNTINIKYMADVIKASDKTYTITGYADATTGSEAFNMDLSQQRAEAVYNTLIDAGVDSSKLKVDYKGCTIQPFDKDYLNRVAIIK